MSTDEIRRKREVLDALKRRLHERELQSAKSGVDADPVIKIETEDIEGKIKTIEREIQALIGRSDRNIPPTRNSLKDKLLWLLLIIIAIIGVTIAIAEVLATSKNRGTATSTAVSTMTVALRTYHGRYVTAMDNGGSWNWVLRAETHTLSDWERFTAICLDDGKIALQTYHGGYVTAMNDEDDREWKLAQTQELKDWEKFTLLNAETGTQLPCLDAFKLFRKGEVSIALRTYHDRYVTAMDNGYDWKLRAQTQELKDWERFTVILP